MKKTIIAIVLLIVVIGAFVFSYKYRNQMISQQTYVTTESTATATQQENVSSTTAQATEKYLLVEDKENDYHIYYDGSTVSIIHGDYLREFTTWGYSVNTQTPTIFCKDYDDDGEKELLIKLVSGRLDNGDSADDIEYTYIIYILKPVISSTGEKTFDAYIASDDTWKTPFENAIKCEMTQLKNCKKFLQFTMDDAKETIEYNEKTGLTTNKHVAYALALADNKNRYYTLSRWNKGTGNYDFDENGTITLDIQVFVNYEEISNEQYIGNIHCEVGITKGAFGIIPNSIVFIPLDEYKITDPRDTAKSNWTCVINNESVNTKFTSTDIDWIEAEFSLTNTSQDNSQPFENMASKIKCVDSVKFTQGSVVLTAKKGYTFSPHIADKGAFAVILNSGEENESNIAYTCSVENENNISTLTIKFDKTYDKEDFDKVLINFGV